MKDWVFVYRILRDRFTSVYLEGYSVAQAAELYEPPLRTVIHDERKRRKVAMGLAIASEGIKLRRLFMIAMNIGSHKLTPEAKKAIAALLNEIYTYNLNDKDFGPAIESVEYDEEAIL